MPSRADRPHGRASCTLMRVLLDAVTFRARTSRRRSNWMALRNLDLHRTRSPDPHQHVAVLQHASVVERQSSSRYTARAIRCIVSTTGKRRNRSLLLRTVSCTTARSRHCHRHEQHVATSRRVHALHRGWVFRIGKHLSSRRTGEDGGRRDLCGDSLYLRLTGKRPEEIMTGLTRRVNA